MQTADMTQTIAQLGALIPAKNFSTGAAKTHATGKRPVYDKFALEEPSELAHGLALKGITQNPAVMKWIANGRTWDANKLATFFKYRAEEKAQGDDVRENYYHIITENGNCVGAVGIHAITYDKKARGAPFLTVFLTDKVSKQGIGTMVIAAALAAYWDRHPRRAVYLDTRTDNVLMRRVAVKLGFKKVGVHQIGMKHYDRFAAVRR